MQIIWTQTALARPRTRAIDKPGCHYQIYYLKTRLGGRRNSHRSKSRIGRSRIDEFHRDELASDDWVLCLGLPRSPALQVMSNRTFSWCQAFSLSALDSASSRWSFDSSRRRVLQITSEQIKVIDPPLPGHWI